MNRNNCVCSRYPWTQICCEQCGLLINIYRLATKIQQRLMQNYSSIQHRSFTWRHPPAAVAGSAIKMPHHRSAANSLSLQGECSHSNHIVLASNALHEESNYLAVLNSTENVPMKTRNNVEWHGVSDECKKHFNHKWQQFQMIGWNGLIAQWYIGLSEKRKKHACYYNSTITAQKSS